VIKIRILATALKNLIKIALYNSIKLYITWDVQANQAYEPANTMTFVGTNQLPNSNKQNVVKHIAFT
jgi:hypothetical protein